MSDGKRPPIPVTVVLDGKYTGRGFFHPDAEGIDLSDFQSNTDWSQSLNDFKAETMNNGKRPPIPATLRLASGREITVNLDPDADKNTDWSEYLNSFKAGSFTVEGVYDPGDLVFRIGKHEIAVPLDRPPSAELQRCCDLFARSIGNEPDGRKASDELDGLVPLLTATDLRNFERITGFVLCQLDKIAHGGEERR